MKKRHIPCLLLIPIFIFGLGAEAQTRLKFNTEGRFKIVQLTDMHINLKRGQSEVCYELIEEAVRTEKPDLIVFTGDLVTESHPEEAWSRLVEQLKKNGVAWTMVFGNHDHEQGLTREAIFQIVSAAPDCLMERGGVKGVGNYMLKIAGSISREPAATLYFIDSHGNCEQPHVGGYQWIDFSQIAWLQKEDKKFRMPALAFFHIPLPEYNEVLKGKIVGEKGENICAPKLNSGLFTVLKEGGNVMGVLVGHDHKNDFIGVYHGIALGYGRVSAGKNAYGSLSPGFRVIELKEGKKEFETYICLKGGEILNRCHYPDTFLNIQ